MFFIHGGHYDQGGAGTEIYDGPTFVARTGVILVSANYRLGALGFLVTDDLNGNFAFRDQLFALKWIRDNIAAFGGDPEQITIFGESAGATSIRAHLVSPSSKGLFHRAILQSDPMSIFFQSRSQSLIYGNTFLKNLGCNTTACLMAKTPDQIVAAQDSKKLINVGNLIQVAMPWAPVVDDELIFHNSAFDAILTGHWNTVPLIVGGNQRDARLFIWEIFNDTLSSWKYALAAAAIFNPKGGDVLNRYPPLGDDSRPVLGQVINDYLFSCPARHLIDLSSQVNIDVPVYLYRWNHSLSWDGWGPRYAECVNYPCHGTELVYEFDPPFRSQISPWISGEATLSHSIMDYFSNFARTGDPNKGPHVPSVVWPVWTQDKKSSLVFQTPNTVVSSLSNYDCTFWDGLGYAFGFNNETKR
eukprot:TRINITY_DN2491_c0_g1_i2.p1 TRINITY_DN2491_c0_g1~~TRINITY_DN2491_c0_g1_i2.p1  ORF type:complete len:415 (-),score=72.93 TRINITY_DN2491_c0_g1_i2:157-1401(-)